MNTLKTIATATLVLAAGLGLTACTASPTPQPTVTGAATTTATPTATPTDDTDGTQGEDTQDEEQPAGYQAGEVLTAAPTDLPVSQRAFPLADGTFVIIDRYQPLPAPVQEAVDAQAAAAVSWTAVATSPAASQVPANEALALRSALTLSTNKNVLVVFKAGDSNIWMSTSGDGPWATREEAQAAGQAIVDGKSDPETWILVVTDGI